MQELRGLSVIPAERSGVHASQTCILLAVREEKERAQVPSGRRMGGQRGPQRADWGWHGILSGQTGNTSTFRGDDWGGHGALGGVTEEDKVPSEGKLSGDRDDLKRETEGNMVLSEEILMELEVPSEEILMEIEVLSEGPQCS